eukprot:c4117_g1_i1.p1 GENE.c4117_g1_i1~~c4117_g1_i1.p1  ORF type:complete len:329 (+),score=72.37 c4117_g1_i1:33-1019(+)
MGQTKSKKSNTPCNNQALVFVKPHAVNQKVIDYVRTRLSEKAKILLEKEITSKEIASKGLIDAHYASIAECALHTSPSKLDVKPDRQQAFADKFSISWSDAISQKLVFNSAEAMKQINTTGPAFSQIISQAQNSGAQVKLGPGLYVVQLKDHNNIFVINGFYEAMRGKFVADGAKIHCFVIEFDPSAMSWAEFRGGLIGTTDPTQAKDGSLRREFLVRYQEFDLPNQPSTSDNCVHASAGPLEGLRERTIWTGVKVAKDPFGAALLKAGIASKQLSAWLNNPVETIGDKTDSIFNLTEDVDSPAVLEMLREIDLQRFKAKATSKLNQK